MSISTSRASRWTQFLDGCAGSSSKSLLPAGTPACPGSVRCERSDSALEAGGGTQTVLSADVTRLANVQSLLRALYTWLGV